MLPNIQDKFDSLNQKRAALLQHLGSLSSQVSSFKTGPDRWSIVEVIEHLVKVEKNLLKQLAKNVPVSALDLKSRTPEKHQTVIKVMERDIPVDVPDERVEPHGRLTFEALLKQWDDIRKKLLEMLADINADNKDNLVYRHPYGGPLDISETLHFIEVHFDNHLRQIDRILAQAKH